MFLVYNVFVQILWRLVRCGYDIVGWGYYQTLGRAIASQVTSHAQELNNLGYVTTRDR